MKWTFPIKKTINCNKCAKGFDIILINHNSKWHTCPHCGTEHFFDFDSAEKQIAEQLKEVVRKAFRRK
jgi:ribosomal protein S27AE